MNSSMSSGAIWASSFVILAALLVSPWLGGILIAIGVAVWVVTR